MALIENNIVIVDETEQSVLLEAAWMSCMLKRNNTKFPSPGASHCPVVWDGLACWPASDAGLVRQFCPNYINGFTITEHTDRMCTESGWKTYPPLNNTWTNFNSCVINPLPTYQPPTNVTLSSEDLMRIRIIYNIGYGLSLVCLLLAVFIMVFFKKLHCQRNTIHINLFLSFILRAVLAFSRDAVLFDGLDNNDMNFNKDGNPDITGMHVRCRLLITLLNYAVSVNYSWIFVEGLYLHMLIFVSVFSESSSVRWYIILGWLLPVSFIVPWIIVRLVSVKDNVMCWNTNPTEAYSWIIKGPIAVAISVTFVFFLNIVRVLFTKMNATNTPEARKYRYRKLAKSTLVLIPLFGVHYIVLLAWPDKINDKSHVVKLYFELSTSSIQGFLVALLFCFLNSEVQTEVRKRFNRLRLGRSWSSHRSRVMSDNTYTYTTYANRRSRGGTSTPPGVNGRSTPPGINGRATPPGISGRATPPSGGAIVNGSGAKRQSSAAPLHIHEGRSKKTSISNRVFNAGSDGRSVITIVVTGPECDNGATTKVEKPGVGVTFAADGVGSTEMTQLVSTSTDRML